MRYLLSVSVLSLLASGALAEEYTLASDVSAVTVYPQGATIIRSIEFDVSAGRHTLVISDIPYEFQSQTLQILGGEGLVFGASRIVSNRVQPDDVQLEQRATLEAEIDALETQIAAAQEESAAAGLMINATAARLKLLDSLSTQQAQGAANALEAEQLSIETLTALVELVGSETLDALQDAQAARVEIAKINQRSEALRKRLSDAREELARLVEPSNWGYGIALEVEAGANVAGILQISYVIEEASWRPVYDFALDTDSESLKVERKVMIGQYTGENWVDAAITVSTSAPFDWQRFSLPHTNLARYEPPAPPVPQLQARVMNDSVAGMAFAAPEVMIVEEAAEMAGATVNFQGITATYALPAGTDVRTNDEGTLVTLNSATFEVNLSARANMGADVETAFLLASLTNDTSEPFLPGSASFFRDGAFVTSGNIDMVAAGATAELGFGRVDGLMVSRNTLRREDGSSGVITTSNDRVVEYAFKIENVTNRAWDVVIYDRIPVSEQEELLIDWTARPRPTETDVEGRRGVMAWEFPLESGESKEIRLSYELEWPEGNELRIGR